MEVKKRWIVLPVVLAILLIGGAYWSISYFQLDDTGSTYSYTEKLFQEDKVGLVEIEMDPEDWTDILANPLDEEYKEANVTINGEKISNVAVRTKGNSSLTSVANSDSERYSLKIDFNHYESTQSFYGLKKLNLNNNFSDSTQMREFVSYELMEQMGLPTPSHSYLKVMINGEYYGLMLGVEEVDETFIAQNFKTTAGYLFKPDGDGSDLVYTSDDLEDYAGIEIKQGENSIENSSITQMMKEISEGDTSSLDTDNLLRYFAMNTALVSLDSYQGQMKHNYYLYENKEGIFSIIPWDYNMSFGGFGVGMGGMPGNLPESTEETGEQSNQSNTTEQDTEQVASPEMGDIPNMGQGTPPDMSNMPNMGQGTPPDMSNMPNMGQGTPPDMGNMPNMGQGTPPDMSNMPNSEQETSENWSEDNQNEAPQMPFGNQQGGMPGMSGKLISEESINFSIYNPVSGTSLEERPLLKVLLEDKELLATYEGYMEQIATEILTEENVSSITTKLETLLLDYVEEDPSKFYTTEEFIEGASGENSLPEFAKQRSESILKQLSGELEVESSTTDSKVPMGGAAPQMNRDEQEDERFRENFNDMTDEEFLSFLENLKDLPEDFDTMSIDEQKEALQDLMGSKMQKRPMGGNRGAEDSAQGYTKEMIYFTGAILLLALIAILAVRKIGR